MSARTRRIALALLALAPLALAACGPKPVRPRDAIVLWAGADSAALAPLARQFEGANPGLHVQLVALAGSSDPDSVAPERPDVPAPDLRLLPSAQMRGMLATGALSDWSAGVADLRDSLAGWPACMVGDAIYGIPLRLDATTLCWNRSLFGRAGLEVRHAPGTWAEVRAAALRIQKLGHGVHGLGVATGDSAETFADFLPWAIASGGGLDATPADSAGSSDAGNRTALDFLLGVRGASLCAGRDTLVREFAAGRLGMMLADGATAGAVVGALRVDVVFDRVAMPRVVADSAAAPATASALVLASPARARHKEGALRFARFLAGAPGQLALHRILRDGLPSSLAAESLLVAQSGGGERAHVELVRTARWAAPVANWSAMGGALGAAVRGALLGRLDPDSALADAATRIAALARR